MSFLDRFKNSEFASVREHATMAEKEFKEAIVISNDCLPPELQTHDSYEMCDFDLYDPTTNEGGKFYGTDLATIERRLAEKNKEESEHKKIKRTKADRLEFYAEQWDEQAAKADEDKEAFVYMEDDAKFHQNAVLFLKLVLTVEEFEDFEDAVEKEIEGS